MKNELVCIFDLNETLMDMSPLEKQFETMFGDALLKTLWFENVLHTSVALSISGRYQEFGKIMQGTLKAMEKLYGITLTRNDHTTFIEILKNLKVHSDAIPALEYLNECGVRSAVLTQSSEKGALAQLSKSNCSKYFEKILSTDSVKAFKPSPKTYQYACKQMRVKPARAWMIAAHDWDTQGAQAAGMSAALLQRSGLVYHPSYSNPDLKAVNLLTLVKLILKKTGT